jgi:hypothetical protein
VTRSRSSIRLLKRGRNVNEAARVNRRILNHLRSSRDLARNRRGGKGTRAAESGINLPKTVAVVGEKPAIVHVLQSHS